MSMLSCCFWDHVAFDEIPSPLEEHAKILEKRGYISDDILPQVVKRLKPCHLHLTIPMLRPFFRHGIDQAADIFEMGTTTFKNKCRVAGISRWPNRKLNSLDNIYKCLTNDYSLQKPGSHKSPVLLEKMHYIADLIAKYEHEGIENETAEEIMLIKSIRVAYNGLLKIM